MKRIASRHVVTHLGMPDFRDSTGRAADGDSGQGCSWQAVIGTRTAGIVAGPANVYELDDGSLLGLPSRHELGASREIINGIGVAPGYYLPLTATDLSTGRDPDIAKALTLLGQ